MKTVFFSFASTSPIYRNNPAYSVMDLTQAPSLQISSLVWRVLDFPSYLSTSQATFSTIEPGPRFGIDLNSYRSVRRFHLSLPFHDDVFIDFIKWRTGNSVALLDQGLIEIKSPEGTLLVTEVDDHFRLNTICAALYITIEAFNTCSEGSNDHY